MHHKAEPRQLLANPLGHLVHTGDAASWVSLESTSSLHARGQTQHCTKKTLGKKKNTTQLWNLMGQIHFCFAVGAKASCSDPLAL